MPKISNTFNFSESCRLLQTNPKTFKGWLKKAGIDANTQINLADPRERYLTRKQLITLAEQHGSILPPLDEQDDLSAEITVATLAEQLKAVEHVVLQRIDLIEETLQQVFSLVSQTSLHQPTMTASLQKQDLLPDLTLAATPPPPQSAEGTAPSLSQSTSSQKAKKAVKGKPLPRSLVPVRVFAEQHQVPMKVADRASKGGKLAVHRGRWLYKSRYVIEALSIQEQQAFYELFHAREDFKLCEYCPHTHSV